MIDANQIMDDILKFKGFKSSSSSSKAKWMLAYPIVVCIFFSGVFVSGLSKLLHLGERK
jgi:hypothetical protein